MVYIVNRGIAALFSTRQLAEEYLAKINNGEISECEVDDLKDAVNKTLYCSSIDLLTGYVLPRDKYEVLVRPDIVAEKTQLPTVNVGGR